MEVPTPPVMILRSLCTEPELGNETQSCSIVEIAAPTMHLECPSVIEVAIPSLTQAPDLRHEEEVEKATYKPPHVHVKMIQMCPENLKASEPQMTIEMGHLTHKHITFKSPIAPGLRPVSEMGIESPHGQPQPRMENLLNEPPDPVQLVEHLDTMMECEAEEVPPASADSEYINTIPIVQDSHVSDEPMEQEEKSEMGHTNGPYPSIHLEVLHRSRPDVAETCMPGLDNRMDTAMLECGSDDGPQQSMNLDELCNEELSSESIVIHNMLEPMSGGIELLIHESRVDPTMST